MEIEIEPKSYWMDVDIETMKEFLWYQLELKCGTHYELEFMQSEYISDVVQTIRITIPEWYERQVGAQRMRSIHANIRVALEMYDWLLKNGHIKET